MPFGLPKNYRGGIKINKNRGILVYDKKRYHYKNKYGRKTFSNNYENYARVIWKKYYGEIPKDEKDRDYCILHKDGNKNNNDISNLELVSRKELTKIILKKQPKVEKECVVCKKKYMARKGKPYFRFGKWIELDVTCSFECHRELNRIRNRKWKRISPKHKEYSEWAHYNNKIKRTRNRLNLLKTKANPLLEVAI